MKWGVNYTPEERKIEKVEINRSLIHSGDLFVIMRMDGIDQLIMFGTGSHVGHTVMALRFDGELYIVEAQEAWYWPIQRIQRNKFNEWIKMAEKADFNVVYMPLSDEKRAVFNETAA